MGVAVDEARDHAAAGGVEAAVGRCASSLHGDHAISLEHQARVADDPQRPLAQRGVVGHQQADVVDRQRAHAGSLEIASLELGGHVETEVSAVADDEPASDHHVAHVRGARGEDE